MTSTKIRLYLLHCLFAMPYSSFSTETVFSSWVGNLVSDFSFVGDLGWLHGTLIGVGLGRVSYGGANGSRRDQVRAVGQWWQGFFLVNGIIRILSNLHKIFQYKSNQKE